MNALIADRKIVVFVNREERPGASGGEDAQEK